MNTTLMVNLKMEKKSELCELISKGDFKKTTQKLNENKSNITQQSALLLLGKCSSFLYKNTSLKVEGEKLYEFLEANVKFLTNLSEQQCSTYITTLYWVVKYLIDHEYWAIILKIEKYLTSPAFCPQEWHKQHQVYYLNTCKIIYNAFIKLPYSAISLKIAHMLSNIFSKDNSVSKYIFICYNCALKLYTNLNGKEIEGYFINAVNLLLNNTKVNDIETFQRLLEFFSYTSETLIAKKNLEEYKNVYDKSTLVVRSLFIEKNYLTIFNIFGIVLILDMIEDDLKKIGSLKRFTVDLKTVIPKIDGNSQKILYKCLFKVIYLLWNPNDPEVKTRWQNQSELIQMEIVHFLFEAESTFISIKYCENPRYFIRAVDLLKISTYEISLQKAVCTHVINDYIMLFNHEKLPVSPEFVNCLYKFIIFLYNNADEITDIAHYSKILLQPKLIKDEKVSHSIFNILVKMFYKKHSYKDCMALTVLIIYLFPQMNNNSFFDIWCKSKSYFRDNDNDELHSLTMYKALFYFEDYLKQFITPDFGQMSTEKRIDLLKIELNIYKTRWPSKIPMFEVVKELYSLDLVITVTVLVQTFIGTFDVHTDFCDLCENITKKYEKFVKSSKNNETRFNLAVLYYLCYKYTVKELIKNNINEVEHNQTILENDFKNQQLDADVPQDPKECDIASNYMSLKLTNHLKIMKYLKDATHILGSVIEANAVPSDMNNNVLNMLIHMAIQFDLNRHSLYSKKVLEIALKFTENLDDTSKLRVISFLIKYVDLDKDSMNISEIGDYILENNIKKSNTIDPEICLMFLLNKSKGLFKCHPSIAYKFYQDARQLFSISIEQFEKRKQEFIVFEAQLMVLKSKFVLLGLESDETELLLTEFHDAFKLLFDCMSVAVYDYYKNSDLSYELTILLEIAEECIKWYQKMPFTSEFRYYTKSLILICQKSVLPLRCIEFLIQLTESDIKMSRFDDVLVKLNGLNDMLCLSSKLDREKLNEMTENKKFTIVDKEIHKVASHMDTLLREAPTSQNKSPSSPVLRDSTISLPSFAVHSNECDCFWCNCMEYKLCVMKFMYLKALNCMFQEQHESANALFNATIKMYQLLEYQEKYYIKRISEIVHNYDFVETFRDSLRTIYYFTLYYYSFHLRVRNNKADTLKINEKLFSLLQPVKSEFSNLYLQVVPFRVSCLTVTLAETSPKRQYLTVPDNNDAYNLIKTPDSKSSQTINTIKPTYSPNMNIQGYIRKQINFDWSDDEDNDKPLRQLAVPVSSNCKTPSFAIYSGAGAKSSKKEPTTAKQTKTAKKTKQTFVNRLVWGSDDDSEKIEDEPTTTKKIGTIKKTAKQTKTPRNTKQTIVDKLIRYSDDDSEKKQDESRATKKTGTIKKVATTNKLVFESDEEEKKEAKKKSTRNTRTAKNAVGSSTNEIQSKINDLKKHRDSSAKQTRIVSTKQTETKKKLANFLSPSSIPRTINLDAPRLRSKTNKLADKLKQEPKTSSKTLSMKNDSAKCVKRNLNKFDEGFCIIND